MAAARAASPGRRRSAGISAPRRAISAPAPAPGALAFLERLEGDDDEGGVRLRVVVDEVQADHRRVISHRLFCFEHLLGLLHHAQRARRPRRRPASGSRRKRRPDRLPAGSRSGSTFNRPTVPNAGDADHDEPDDRESHDARDRRAIGIPHAIDARASPSRSGRAAARDAVAETRRTAPATASTH